MKKSTLISKGLLGTTFAASILGYGLTANAAGLTQVSLELALLIDGSDSISDEHFYDQIDALGNIFNDPNFYNDFVLPLKGKQVADHKNYGQTVVINDPSVAVSIYQFGSGIDPDNRQLVYPVLEQIADWTVFNGQHQSGMGQLDSMTINKVGGFTPIGDVLDLMIKEFSNNSYDGHQTVNLSSDGFETESSSSVNSLDMAFLLFDSGVTSNALAIPTTLDAQRGEKQIPLGTFTIALTCKISSILLVMDSLR